MLKNRLKSKLPLVITIAVNALMLVAVLFLMNHVQKLLYSDVQINLAEVVSQNKDVITSKLMLELNNLDLAATQIGARLKQQPDLSEQSFARVIEDYCNESDDEGIFLANQEGVAFFGDGKKLSIAGRRYFKLAIDGRQNISDRIVSRATGDDIFVLSVPLLYQGQLIGTVQKPYSPEQIYSICSLSLFSSKGYMYIINSEGYILVSSLTTNYNQETDNYFWNIFAQGNQDAANQLTADIQQNRAGFMETVVSGQTIFSAYTPIEDLHDWYLISSVATNAVSPNANTVIRMFYFILLVIVFVFGGSLFAFFAYKNRQQENLERIAFVDAITQGNTYNRFLVDLNGALKQHPEKKHYLLAFDIDNFKYVNSFYGFDFGDQVLHRIYHDISRELTADETIARISGDHFIVLLEDASELRLAQLLKQTILENDVPVYLSAGLYAITDPTESMNLMVDKASTTAQMAKGSFQRSIVTYSEEHNQAMIYNEQLKRQMEVAIADREIVAFYQPKVDVNTKRMIGAEALARWKRTDGRMVSPGDFIPLCEKSGQIVDVDFLIFEQVLEFLAENLKNKVPCVPISVNFSRLHLLGDAFIMRIIERLMVHDVPASLVQVELTESIFLGNTQTILNFVNHMHEYGLLVCIDDFGSGYSSLNMLKEIPLDVLKIDKGFLDDTRDRERQRIILSTIAQMAERLHIDVVVEGVETEENVRLMKEFGCSVAQGYYFSKPMDEVQFREVFRRGSV